VGTDQIREGESGTITWESVCLFSSFTRGGVDWDGMAHTNYRASEKRCLTASPPHNDASTGLLADAETGRDTKE
jgi:hypothetical protein